MKKWNSHSFLKEVRFYTVLFIIAITLAIAMRVFLFASFKIPSPSMEPAVLAGDYIFDSTDSRYWGLLPEDHIIGKAILVWKSKDMNIGKIRWNRIFNTI